MIRKKSLHSSHLQKWGDKNLQSKFICLSLVNILAFSLHTGHRIPHICHGIVGKGSALRLPFRRVQCRRYGRLASLLNFQSGNQWIHIDQLQIKHHIQCALLVFLEVRCFDMTLVGGFVRIYFKNGYFIRMFFL